MFLFLKRIYLQVGEHYGVHVWRSEENLQDLLLSCHHVGPEDKTQFGDKHLYALSYLPVGAGDPDSCLHACMASTLLTGPSPQPQNSSHNPMLGPSLMSGW